jgi:hypothetical protein
LLLEGSGSVQIITDPYPEGPKTYVIYFEHREHKHHHKKKKRRDYAMLESTAGGATVLTAGFKREPETAGIGDYPWPVQETSASEEAAPPVSRLIKQEYPAGRPVSATGGGVKREYGAGDAMETSSADYYSSSGSTASPQPPAKVGIIVLPIRIFSAYFARPHPVRALERFRTTFYLYVIHTAVGAVNFLNSECCFSL